MVSTQPAVIAASTAERIAEAAARQAVYAYRGVVAPTLDDDVIEPFVLDAPSVVLDDLGQRVATAQASREAGGSRTGDAATNPRVGALLDRWTGGYNWAAQEARLNAVPQFTTTIDGAPLHFFHVESQQAAVRPLCVALGESSLHARAALLGRHFAGGGTRAGHRLRRRTRRPGHLRRRRSPHHDHAALARARPQRSEFSGLAGLPAPASTPARPKSARGEADEGE